MQIVFPWSPFSRRQPDPHFEAEYAAAQEAGFETSLISVDDILGSSPYLAVRQLEEGQCGIYRGWMLPVDGYAKLCDEARARGFEFLTSPENYRWAHWLPESYPSLVGKTPVSVWRAQAEGLEDEALLALLAKLGPGPALVKDYVKSRKHEWLEACYIPETADTPHALKVIRRFLELQDDDVQGGVVLRRFVPLHALGYEHDASGIPLFREFRLFYFAGKRVLAAPYWDAKLYETEDLEDAFASFDALAREMPSPFFTMDVAQSTTGQWLVIEVGDGQVSGIPDGFEPLEFYRRLKEVANA